jgi:RNA polymerase sigma-70 factor (ECF subfamily)
MDAPEPDAARGDIERFERLYEQHFDRVAAYLLARVDRDAAADALAGTFEVAWRRIADVPEHELPWLLGVARRVLANARRSRARQAALVERMSSAAAPLTGGDDEDAAVTAGLAAAIAQLTASQQEALLLIAWDGLSEREAALALGCSRAAFASRLHRARARVRDAIDAARDAPPPPSLAAAQSSRFPLSNSIEEAT